MWLALALILLGLVVSWLGLLLTITTGRGPDRMLEAVGLAGIAILAVGVLRGAFLLGRWLGRSRGPGD